MATLNTQYDPNALLRGVQVAINWVLVQAELGIAETEEFAALLLTCGFLSTAALPYPHFC